MECGFLHEIGWYTQQAIIIITIIIIRAPLFACNGSNEVMLVGWFAKQVFYTSILLLNVKWLCASVFRRVKVIRYVPDVFTMVKGQVVREEANVKLYRLMKELTLWYCSAYVMLIYV